MPFIVRTRRHSYVTPLRWQNPDRSLAGNQLIKTRQSYGARKIGTIPGLDAGSGISGPFQSV
jgi:hypothetical protein